MHKLIQSTKASTMQQKAICHKDGPVRVLAGPGSGKTFTVIQRIIYLIHHFHILPEQILCITFTKAAALEMQERYQMQMTENSIAEEKSVCFGTVHSICYHIIKDSGEFCQYSLITETKKRKILEMLLINRKLSDYTNYTMITELLHAFSRKKNGLLFVEDDLISPAVFEALFLEYDKALKERQLLDFDDMISAAFKILKHNEVLRRKWQKRFAYVIVDEFQDVNRIQYEVIKLLAGPWKNLFIVGDDDQSIYGFRGAMPDIMQQFKTDFPDATDLYLTENFRSCEKIVSLAGRIISQNKNRIHKSLLAQKKGGIVNIYFEESGKEEEQRLLEHLARLSGEILCQSAVIVRTNREAIRYLRLIKTHQIPVMESRDRQQISPELQFIQNDFEAFLRFCKEGYRRRDFLQIMNKPEHFIAREALTEEIVSLEKLMEYYKENKKIKEAVRVLFFHLKKAEKMTFSMAVRYFRNVIGYNEYLKERAKGLQEYEEYMRIADEWQLIYKKQKENESCDAFFHRIRQEDLFLSQKETKKSQTKGISVITMHSAKGLEFQQVFLPDVNEGVIPAKQSRSFESIEEERRLLYVAVTRAKEVLTIYYTKERGRKPSRFIAGEKPILPNQ